MKQIYFIRGLPGSGKSTLARSDMFAGFKHFEADMFFEHDGEYRFNPAKISDAHEWCQSCVINEMTKGEDIVVSNTFTKISELSFYMEQVRLFGYTAHLIHLTANYGSIHNVPDSVMQKMNSRFVPNQQIVDHFNDIDIRIDDVNSNSN